MQEHFHCLSQDFVGDFFLDRFYWLYMVLWTCFM